MEAMRVSWSGYKSCTTGSHRDENRSREIRSGACLQNDATIGTRAWCICAAETAFSAAGWAMRTSGPRATARPASVRPGSNGYVTEAEHLFGAVAFHVQISEEMNARDMAWWSWAKGSWKHPHGLSSTWKGYENQPEPFRHRDVVVGCIALGRVRYHAVPSPPA
jgi:hypothetical protein